MAIVQDNVDLGITELPNFDMLLQWLDTRGNWSVHVAINEGGEFNEGADNYDLWVPLVPSWRSDGSASVEFSETQFVDHALWTHRVVRNPEGRPTQHVFVCDGPGPNDRKEIIYPFGGLPYRSGINAIEQWNILRDIRDEDLVLLHKYGKLIPHEVVYVSANNTKLQSFKSRELDTPHDLYEPCECATAGDTLVWTEFPEELYELGLLTDDYPDGIAIFGARGWDGSKWDTKPQRLTGPLRYNGLNIYGLQVSNNAEWIIWRTVMEDPGPAEKRDRRRVDLNLFGHRPDSVLDMNCLHWPKKGLTTPQMINFQLSTEEGAVVYPAYITTVPINDYDFYIVAPLHGRDGVVLPKLQVWRVRGSTTGAPQIHTRTWSLPMPTPTSTVARVACIVSPECQIRAAALLSPASGEATYRLRCYELDVNDVVISYKVSPPKANISIIHFRYVSGNPVLRADGSIYAQSIHEENWENWEPSEAVRCEVETLVRAAQPRAFVVSLKKNTVYDEAASTSASSSSSKRLASIFADNDLPVKKPR
jgi:hypothetical protein